MNKFGKLTDGNLVLAPYPLCDGDRKIFTSDSSVYLEHGWKEIVSEPYPVDGKNYERTLSETATQIRYIWREAENINAIE